MPVNNLTNLITFDNGERHAIKHMFICEYVCICGYDKAETCGQWTYLDEILHVDRFESTKILLILTPWAIPLGSGPGEWPREWTFLTLYQHPCHFNYGG